MGSWFERLAAAERFAAFPKRPNSFDAARELPTGSFDLACDGQKRADA
jgi:hypothetical protein